MKLSILTLAISLLFTAAIAQKKVKTKQCFYVVKSDTTFCTKLKVKARMISGKTKKIKYISAANKRVKLKGKSAPQIFAYNYKGKDFELIEYGLGKSFVERLVYGPFSTYLKIRKSSSGGKTKTTHWFFVKTPEGVVCDINGVEHMKIFKDNIKPILMKCSFLVKNNSEDITAMEKGRFQITDKEALKDALKFTLKVSKLSAYEKRYTEIIEIYNANCK